MQLIHSTFDLSATEQMMKSKLRTFARKQILRKETWEKMTEI